jgi:peptidoglycan/LPS O-acetylase OafA/YrhL
VRSSSTPPADQKDSASDTRCSDLRVGCTLAVLMHRRFRIPAFLLRPIATLIPLSVLLAAAWFDARARHAIAIAFFYTPAAVATALLMLQCIALCDRRPFRWLDWAVLAMGPVKYSWQIILVFGRATVFASASHHCIEQPFLRLRRRLT